MQIRAVVWKKGAPQPGGPPFRWQRQPLTSATVRRVCNRSIRRPRHVVSCRASARSLNLHSCRRKGGRLQVGRTNLRSLYHLNGSDGLGKAKLLWLHACMDPRPGPLDPHVWQGQPLCCIACPGCFLAPPAVNGRTSWTQHCWAGRPGSSGFKPSQDAFTRLKKLVPVGRNCG